MAVRIRNKVQIKKLTGHRCGDRGPGCFFSGRGCDIRHSIILTLWAPNKWTGNGTWVTIKKIFEEITNTQKISVWCGWLVVLVVV